MATPVQTPTFFDPRRVGESLHEVAVDVISTEVQSVVSRWFHSNLDADLFIWLDEQRNIIKQQLSFCGQIVEWNIIEGVKTGLVVESGDEDGVLSVEEAKKVPGSETIQFDGSPANTSVQMALRLLHHVESLDGAEKETLAHNFSEQPKMSEMDPNEFVKRYGGKAETAPKGLWSRFWSQLRFWLSGRSR